MTTTLVYLFLYLSIGVLLAVIVEKIFPSASCEPDEVAVGVVVTWPITLVILLLMLFVKTVGRLVRWLSSILPSIKTRKE